MLKIHLDKTHWKSVSEQGWEAELATLKACWKECVEVTITLAEGLLGTESTSLNVLC